MDSAVGGQASIPRTHGKVCEGARGLLEMEGRERERSSTLRRAPCLLFSLQGADSEKASLLGWSLGSLSPFSLDRRILADIVACMLPSSDSALSASMGAHRA